MAAFDTTAANAVLKVVYQAPGTIVNQAYRKDALFGLIPKKTKALGQNKQFTQEWAYGAGSSASFGVAQANKSASQYSAFNVTTVTTYSLASVTNEVILKTQGDSNALTQAVTSEVNSAIKAAAEDISFALWRNGGGARGKIASGSATATVTLTNVSDTRFFFKNMWVQGSTADGTSGAVKPGRAQVTNVDRSAGTVTFSAAYNTLVTGGADADFLFKEGTFGACANGLESWCPAAAPSATLFFGVDRSQDTRLGGLRTTGGGAPMDEVLMDATALSVAEGGDPNYLFANPTDWAKLLKILSAKKIYTEPVDVKAGGNATIGYRAVQVPTGVGMVNVVATPFCQPGVAWLLQMDTWELFSAGPDDVPYSLTGKMEFLYEPNADAIELRLGAYYNVGNYAVGYNQRITW